MQTGAMLVMAMKISVLFRSAWRVSADTWLHEYTLQRRGEDVRKNYLTAALGWIWRVRLAKKSAQYV